MQDKNILTALLDIAEAVRRLAEAVEDQNNLLRDVVRYPADQKQPPRVIVGVAGAVEVMDI